MALLEIRGLTKRFFGLTALDDVEFDVQKGELLSLIGPNGSGKTTLFNCVTNFLQKDGGQVYFDGREITNMAPHRIALLGVSRTFQQARVLRQLTVVENLLMGVQQHQGDTTMDRILATGRARTLECQARSAKIPE